jgi:hypothetical protein
MRRELGVSHTSIELNNLPFARPSTNLIG